MLEVNGDIEKMVELLGAARSEMVTQLAVAMAITRDALLRGRAKSPQSIRVRSS